MGPEEAGGQKEPVSDFYSKQSSWVEHFYKPSSSGSDPGKAQVYSNNNNLWLCVWFPLLDMSTTVGRGI